MTDKKTFKGFSLDSRGDVIGAFPTVDVIQERAKNLMNEVTGNINQMTIDYCLKFNIAPDVLIKQKAEIELLQMKNKELEKENAKLESDFRICEKNADTYYDQLTKATDLLKKFIETSNPIYFDEDRQKVKVDAEQFLKEIEK